MSRYDDDPQGYDDSPERPEKSAVSGKLAAPGIILIIVGALNVLGALYFAANGAIVLALPPAQLDQMMRDNPFVQGQKPTPELLRGVGIGYLVVGALGVLASILEIVGGINMMRVRGYGMAMFGSILAMIPCISPCCLLGLVPGIWGLVVLMQPDVKNAFQ